MIRGEQKTGSDFFRYWEELGFFSSARSVLPGSFMLLFDIARILETDETSRDALNAIEKICDESEYRKSPEEELERNRVDRTAPLGDRMEIDVFKKINDLKKALPRELALDDDVFGIKLMTRSLLVQRFYETDEDRFKSIKQSDRDERDINRFDQKFYLLLDRSRSMEKKQRIFYVKCIVAELLRRKMGSGARLYYRAFDSETGPLATIRTRADYPNLIETILLTETGGTGTNLQQAIFTAVNDITYEKEMMHSEILLITDGMAVVDREAVKNKLGPIRLNILKIGDDKTEPDWFAIEDLLQRENIAIDPFRQDMSSVEEKRLETSKAERAGTLDDKSVAAEKKQYRIIQEFVEKIDRDLKELSHRFIQVGDLDTSKLSLVSDATLAAAASAVRELEHLEKNEPVAEERLFLFKKAHFLLNYLIILSERPGNHQGDIREHIASLEKLKSRLLDDPELFMMVREIPGLSGDKKIMKLAGKNAKAALKKMRMEGKSLSLKQMKLANLLGGGGGAGNANPALFFMILIIKLMTLAARLITAPFRKNDQGENTAEGIKGERHV